VDRFNTGAIHCCAGRVSYNSGQVTADGLTLPMPAVKATKLNIANATSRILELEKRRFMGFAPEKQKFDSPYCPGLVMKWAMPRRSQAGIPSPNKSAFMQTAFQNKTRVNRLFCNVL
jgi:hypothetical protein